MVARFSATGSSAMTLLSKCNGAMGPAVLCHAICLFNYLGTQAMAVARARILGLSLALSVGVFPWIIPVQAQGIGQSNDRQNSAGEMPVHEVKPGKLKVAVEARGSLEAARVADLYCPVEGQSTILSLVPEGRGVKKGDLVCELNGSFLRDQLVNQEIAEQRSTQLIRTPSSHAKSPKSPSRNMWKGSSSRIFTP